MVEQLCIEEFLDKKRDFSPLLVHLTRDDDIFFAKDVLCQILTEKTLRAYYHYCLFSPSLKESSDTSLQNKFKVVCFTETPIDQIDILLSRVRGRNIKLDPYGLVFKKGFIKQHGGNPVFYATKEIAKPFWGIYWKVRHGGMQSLDAQCRLLALVTVCEEGNDWHWEREWRIVGDLKFGFNDIYCGLCPEEDIPYFEKKYAPVKFISPYWGINKILDKLVGR